MNAAKTTYRPSAESDGSSADGSSARTPFGRRSTSVVVFLRRSRTNTCPSPRESEESGWWHNEAKGNEPPIRRNRGFATHRCYPWRHRSRWRGSPAPSVPVPHRAHTPASRLARGIRLLTSDGHEPPIGGELRRGRPNSASAGQTPLTRVVAPGDAPRRQTPPTTPRTTRPFPHTPPAARGRRGNNASRRSSRSVPASASVASPTRPADAGTGAEPAIRSCRDRTGRPHR